MLTLLVLASLVALSWGGQTEGEAYLMLELEPALYERNIVKRQVQYAEPVHQYAGQAQISPEYYAYLQQVQAQQYQAQQQGVDLNQVLSARGPQRFVQPLTTRRPPVPEEVRRLQEQFAQQPIREQEREDQTNQQLIAAGLNPGQVRRERLRQSAQRLAIQQAQENAARQALNAQLQQHQQQYHQLYAEHQLGQPQLVAVPQEVQQPAESTPAPERVSYSQVAFGSTKLPQQKLVPGKTQQFIYTRPQEQPTQRATTYRQQQQAQPQAEQQVVYQPQYVYTTLPQEERAAARQPQLVYTQQETSRAQPQYVLTQQPQRLAPDSYQPQKAQAVSYQPQRTQAVTYQPQRVQAVAYQPQKVQAVAYHPQAVQPETYQPGRAVSFQPQAVQYPLAEVTQKQTPDQYLIETTRTQPQPQQQVVTIPRRTQLSYRPEADYQELHAAFAARQQEAHLARQQAEAVSSTTPAPRSSIFVTTSRTPKTYSLPAEYTRQHQRPLTENELNALINAGFRVGPEEQPEFPQHYLRGLAKRQNSRPPKVGKVPLSEEERQVLAKNGIRSLYRVQSAESQDAPVTYVLAVENQKRDTEKSTSS